MTHPHSLALPLVAALALAGCSATGSNPPAPSPDVYDALANGMASSAVGSDGNSVATGDAEVAMTRSGSEIEVRVDGQVYNMASTSQQAFTNAQWQNQRQYIDYRFAGGGDSSSLIAGEYMAITGVQDGGNGNVYLMHGGVETASSGLPNQSAVYEGAWEIGHVSGAANSTGVYEANADFNAGSIAFNIANSSGGGVGSGTGTISGNSFDSTFDVNSGATPSNNNVTGNFYGPTAEEMAGIIQGNEALGAGDPTYGVLYGHQK